jgi:hypothetical protein
MVAPWLIASLVGTVFLWRSRDVSVLLGGVSEFDQPVSREGMSLYFMPQELSPFFRTSLETLGAEPLDRLPCSLARKERVALLVLNRWKTLDDPSALLVHSAISYGKLGTSVTEALPRATRDFSLITLEGAAADPELAASWCAGGIAPARTSRPPAAVAVARPESQLRGDGWSYLEFDRSLYPFRWSSREHALLRFDRPVDRGLYRLTMFGRTRRHLDRPASMTVIPSGGKARVVEIEPGGFSVSVDVEILRSSNRPLILSLIAEVETRGAGGGRERTTGIQFREAWIERRPE